MSKFLKLISGLLLIAGATSPVQAQEVKNAVSILRDTQGNFVGTALLTPTEKGVQIQVYMNNFGSGVTNNQRGQHGFHIHEVGQCNPPDFSSAGGHFNPTGNDHGLLDPDGAHAGDLPNIWVEEDGTADYSVTTDLVSLGTGNRSLFDSNGSAFVIHQEADDYLTDPAGDADSRIACGVIFPYS